MQRGTLSQHFPTGLLPTWSWIAAALLLVMFLTLLFASGALLAPVFGHAATMTNYVHEFTHDGRHLLAVPCH